MPAGGAEPERLQKFLRDLRRMDLREPAGRHASRVELREQLLQTGATVLDERAERDTLPTLHIEKAGLDFRSSEATANPAMSSFLAVSVSTERSQPNRMDVSRRSRR
jgi:hypothetical protein